MSWQAQQSAHRASQDPRTRKGIHSLFIHGLFVYTQSIKRRHNGRLLYTPFPTCYRPPAHDSLVPRYSLCSTRSTYRCSLWSRVVLLAPCTPVFIASYNSVHIIMAIHSLCLPRLHGTPFARTPVPTDVSLPLPPLSAPICLHTCRHCSTYHV